ncbi:hypothetical protein Rsub_06736 [Raphidocelis subcapitata]|uniref:Ubiquitin carboxyl-terminal hydrolase n=1 Tax=Raphidocelis subcapitata TaxID=307507 RepID=A0A2V0P423_9CHLO|nr:hypothetical protein Rsub_06736 [Raphidocelis subcapitata]|eukprot:GBF94621.1 hypothetical protein Rsub_06736 [Raphidocelis subcapitata]
MVSSSAQPQAAWMPSPAPSNWATAPAPPHALDRAPQQQPGGGGTGGMTARGGGGGGGGGGEAHEPCTVAAAARLSPAWQRAQGPGVGLVNLGNSCFLNSVLQALAYLPPLGNLCLARAHARGCGLPQGSCTACKLEEQLARLLTRSGGGGLGGGGFGGGADAPEALHRALPVLNRSFVRGRQEDAHELLRCLVDALERDLLRSEGRWAPGARRQQARGGRGCRVAGAMVVCPGTLANVLFQGSVVNTVTCLACGHESKTWDPIQMLLYDDPNVLVVHLKRFDGFLGGKISGHVAFGERLDLEPFLACRKRHARRWQSPAHHHGGGGGGGHHHPHPHHQQQQQQQDGHQQQQHQPQCKGEHGGAAAAAPPPSVDAGRSVYRLHGVLVHAGLSARAGHYYTFFRDGLQPSNGWHCANDSTTYRVSWQRVAEQDAYILFYVRETMKPLAALPAPAEAPPAGAAGAAAGAGAKRAAGAIGPQLPPELEAKRRRAEAAEGAAAGQLREGEGAGVIGPALPPSWGAGAAAPLPAAAAAAAAERRAGPGAFSRVASGGAGHAEVPPPRPRASFGGTTRIGPPLLAVKALAPRPKAPAAAAPPTAAPAPPAAGPAPPTAAAAPPTAAPKPAAPAAAAPPAPDAAVAAMRRDAVPALLDAARAAAGVVAALRAAALRRAAGGLPLLRPSEMPPAERLELQRAVGSGAKAAGWELVSSQLMGAPELAAWRARVEAEARAEAEAEAARGRGG